MTRRAAVHKVPAPIPDVIRRPANAEMVQGYMDGFDLDAPEPSENRSHSYRHGFANARDDKRGKPRASFNELNRLADLAMEKDEALHHG